MHQVSGAPMLVPAWIFSILANSHSLLHRGQAERAFSQRWMQLHPNELDHIWNVAQKRRHKERGCRATLFGAIICTSIRDDRMSWNRAESERVHNHSRR
jgi:hypothetical protein